MREYADILMRVDHTLLNVEATWEDIAAACDDAVEYGCASVCIPPRFVRQAKEYLRGAMAVCTVVGFPNGYSTTAAKVGEATDAIANGADEIDMVISIGALKAGEDDYLFSEITAVKRAARGRILKVIVESDLLSDEELVRVCGIVTAAGADYIKTSTGFFKGGATPHAVEIMAANVGSRVKIKAAGGISTLEDARMYIDLGCSRLGSSRIVKLVKEKQEA